MTVNMIIEKLICRVNNYKSGDPKILELADDEYSDLMLYITEDKEHSILSGDTGYDVDKGCYVLWGFEIRRAA